MLSVYFGIPNERKKYLSVRILILHFFQSFSENRTLSLVLLDILDDQDNSPTVQEEVLFR
jgi:hypothetical protein